MLKIVAFDGTKQLMTITSDISGAFINIDDGKGNLIDVINLF